MKEDKSIFIQHIIESIENIESFSEGVSKKQFLKNKEKQSAIIRQIEIIGEAVKNLPIDFTVKYEDFTISLSERSERKLVAQWPYRYSKNLFYMNTPQLAVGMSAVIS